MKFTKENVFGLFGDYRINKNGIQRLDDLEKAIIDLDDTPEKAVVPKCFDEWFKEIYERGPIKNARKQFALWKICQFGFGSYLQNVNGEDIKDCELSTWVGNNRMIAIDAVLNGYEVKKEPLYHVKFPNITNCGFSIFLFKEGNGEIEIADNADYERMRFTEAEIKAIDERYWAFAVPVND